MTADDRKQMAEALIGARANINACLRLLVEEQKPATTEKKKPLTFGDPNPDEDDGA